MHVLASKPDGDLPSRIFQSYSVRLAQAFGAAADELSTQFLEAGQISREKWDEVQFAQKTPIQKGNLLLGAILLRFAIDGGDRTLRKVCKIMSRHKHLKKLSAEIQAKYGT